MTDINSQICNPEVIEKIFDKTHAVRIPFSALNSTIGDMLTVYASRITQKSSIDSIIDILGEAQSVKYDKTNSYFYIFGPTCHELFLQLIAIENYTTPDNIWRYTSSYAILYSNASGNAYADCEPYDPDNFWNILNTRYASTFSADKTHIIKIVTKQVKPGVKPTETTDICLYVPEGKIIPSISLAIEQNKKKYMGMA